MADLDGINSRLDVLAQRVDTLDKRDTEQYMIARQQLTDSHALLMAKVETVEHRIAAVKCELDGFRDSNTRTLSNLTTSLSQIDGRLADISEHGTKTARHLEASLSNIRVNGGVYSLPDALHYIGTKLDEVVKLTSTLRVRRRWLDATRELIQRDGVLRWWLHSRVGVVMLTVLVIAALNTILHGFGINSVFDIGSIIKTVLSLFK